jgi:hypothetical protein
MYAFGSGVLIGTPAGANQTPINFGLVQDVTYDETTTLKELYGQNRRALAIGAGTIKATVKAKMARISGVALASLLYGVATVPGHAATAFGEAGTIPTTPYQVTVANSATWTVDQGVVFTLSGLPLKRVASAPITGQYSVAAGVYTFAAADTTKAVLITYNYTIAGSGLNIPLGNPLLGPTVNFAANLYGVDPTTGLSYSLQLANCVTEKFSFGTKLEDFLMPELDFRCYANAAGVYGQWNFPDIG